MAASVASAASPNRNLLSKEELDLFLLDETLEELESPWRGTRQPLGDALDTENVPVGMEYEIQQVKTEAGHRALEADRARNELAEKKRHYESVISDLKDEVAHLQGKCDAEADRRRQEVAALQKTLGESLAFAKERQQKIEAQNPLLHAKVSEIREEILAGGASEARALELKSKPEDELSLRELISLKFGELRRDKNKRIEELRRRVDHLEQRNRSLESDARTLQTKAVKLEQVLDSEQENQKVLERRHADHISVLTGRAEKAEKALTTSTYQNTHYDGVVRQRDAAQQELSGLRSTITFLEGQLATKTEELEDREKELVNVKTQLDMLNLDKGYLSKESETAVARLHRVEEQLETTRRQADELKNARDEIYERLVTARESAKQEFEAKLNAELASLKDKTHAELADLRNNTRDSHQQELATLRSMREDALAERDRAIQNEREALRRLEEVSTDLRARQIELDGRVVELEAALKAKAFEAERYQIMHQEQSASLRTLTLERDRMRKEVAITQKEFYAFQTRADSRIAGLESNLKTARERLEVYEKLESQLDDAVLQAADSHDDGKAMTLMEMYAKESGITTSGKRRLQQSVELARKGLRLEKEKAELEEQCKTLRYQVDKLKEQLTRNDDLLRKTNQPYAYLIQSLKQKDNELVEMSERLDLMRQDLSTVSEEKLRATRERDRLQVELEGLLTLQDELQSIKAKLVAMRQSHHTLDDVATGARPASPINIKAVGHGNRVSRVRQTYQLKKKK
eukprot:Clim_evm88s134 gene=Clim_evmTU88s134